MEILIICQAQSEGNLLNVYEGRADYALTPQGHQQAKQLASYLSETFSLDGVYCSPLLRARQTAEYIEEMCQVGMLVDEELVEFDYGQLTGMEKSEANKKFPPIYNQPPEQSAYGQETPAAFFTRVQNTLPRIFSSNDEHATIAIITHEKVINQLYRTMLEVPDGQRADFVTGETGIHRWSIGRGKFQIVYANLMPHLQNA